MSNVTETVPGPAGPQGTTGGGNAVVGYLGGIRDVVVLEMKQRLRSRGWYIMLGIWFVVIAVVTWLTWAAWNASAAVQRSMPGSGTSLESGPGSAIFEAVLVFVLLFALLVAPALSANAVNGDRAGGTLAILQVTLLTPGQILWGKFLAAWLAALAFLVTSTPFLVFGLVQGGLSPGHILVSLLMLGVEIAIVCGIGVGISALAARPLFSIVVSYLTVAGLVVLSLIAFGFGMQLTQESVTVDEPGPSMAYIPPPGSTTGPQPIPCRPVQQTVFHTERVALVLAINPFVVVADAIPYPERGNTNSMLGAGMLEGISQGTRQALAGPRLPFSPCVDGVYQPQNQQLQNQYQYLQQTTPVWPLGLSMQVVLAGLLMWLGWRALRTPANRLARGTRIA